MLNNYAFKPSDSTSSVLTNTKYDTSPNTRSHGMTSNNSHITSTFHNLNYRQSYPQTIHFYPLSIPIICKYSTLMLNSSLIPCRI